MERLPNTHEGDPRAGFVTCGDAGVCDLGAGNQCYACGSTEDWQCHTLDLPVRCADAITIVRRECDGDEDCARGTKCVEDAYRALLCR